MHPNATSHDILYHPAATSLHSQQKKKQQKTLQKHFFLREVNIIVACQATNSPKMGT